jgi:hydrogenase expression/formation protein HypC
MCLAIPAKIISINGDEAVAEIQGVRRKIVVSLIPDPQIGDYVLIHAGFAIKKWSEEDVREYNEITGGSDLMRNSR